MWDNSDTLKLNTVGFFFFVNAKDTNLSVQVNFDYMSKTGGIQSSCNYFNEEYPVRQEKKLFAQSRS